MKGSSLDQNFTALNAILLYDQFDSAASAKISLQHCAASAGEDVKWSVRPWRLDLLEQPPAAQDALDEALSADLILVVTARQLDVPEWLREWLSLWAACRKVPEAALAVLCISPKGRSAPALVVELRDCARRHGLNFVSNLDQREPAVPDLRPRHSRRRTAWMRPVLRQLARNCPGTPMATASA